VVAATPAQWAQGLGKKFQKAELKSINKKVSKGRQVAHKVSKGGKISSKESMICWSQSGGKEATAVLTKGKPYL